MKAQRVKNNMPLPNPPELVRIEAWGKSTTDLLGEILAVFNAGNRATFLCDSASGVNRVQQLRMRLARLRGGMDSKGVPKQHFRMESRGFPYINRKGARMECVDLEKKVTLVDMIAEILEGKLKNADTRGNGSGQDNRTNGGFEW